MPGFALLKGSVFDWDGVAFRVERANKDGQMVLERLSDGMIALETRDRLLQDYSEGRVSFGQTSSEHEQVPTFSRALEELPAEVKAEVHRRWSYIQFLIDEGEPKFTKSYLGPLIATAAKRMGDLKPPSTTTVYRWYSKFRTSRDPRALIPRFDRRGSVKSKQPQVVMQLVSQAVTEAFEASPLATVASIHVRLLSKIAAENRCRMPGDRLKPPSKRTLYRLMNRIEVHDLLTLREGKAAADRRLRLNKVGTDTTDILERVEIDHTPLDLFLIDEKTWLPLGRPTLTVLIDHYSRMLLGYYLSYGDPSAAAVMGALRHAILPKAQATTSIPSLETKHVWACYGVPDMIVVDNGLEFHGRDLEDVCFDLGMKILYCPKHQPRFKGTVERYLKTVNYGFAHQLPGTSFARLHFRGDYDPQRHALLTLAEFVALFEKWALDVYSQQVHRTIGVTPWSRWHEGLKRREPALPADRDDLQRRIGLISERSLRRTGIHLHGIRYSCGELQPILSAYGEGVRVRVLFDAEDLGTIQVWGPDEDKPLSVPAVDQSYARGLTMRQNDLIRESLREKGAATEDSVALQEAKQELAVAVMNLMTSRKQRQRRRSGAIRGISSNQTSEDFGLSEAQETPTVRQQVPAFQNALEDAPVVRYASFRIKGGR